MNLYTRLINKDHPLPPDYVPENLTDIGIPFDAPCGDPKRLLEIHYRTCSLLTDTGSAERISEHHRSLRLSPRSCKRQQQLSAGNQISPAPVNGITRHQ